MAKMKGPPPPPKVWTIEEVDRGIRRLERRIPEIEALKTVNFDEQVVDTATSNLVNSIRETFGDPSPELNEHQYHRIWKGSLNIGDSPQSRQRKFLDGIPETVALIQGLIQRLAEKKEELGDGTAIQHATFGGLSLHARIREVSEQLYQDGHYPEAVFAASKALVNLVKEKSGRLDKDGAPLMFACFLGDNPTVVFNSRGSQSELDEQEGLGHLFAGAVLALRNPRGHDFIGDSPERAMEYIAFLSLLAKKLDEAKKA